MSIARINVKVATTTGNLIEEVVDFEYGNKYAEFGLIDPNNPDGSNAKTDDEIKIKFLDTVLTKNFFRVNNKNINSRWIEWIDLEILSK